jgi:acetyl esterase/lipase
MDMNTVSYAVAAMTQKIKDPTSPTSAALGASYAGAADTLRLRALTDLAASDRQKSSAASRVSYEDATSFIEPWAGLTNWSSSTFGQVSAGRFYSNSQAGNSGANHSFALAANENLRAVFNVQTVASSSGNGGMMIGVTSDTAGGAFTAGGATVRGLYFRSGTSNNLVTMTDGVAGGTALVTFVGTQDWVVTLTVDETLITATAVLATDTTTEYRAKWARNTVNNITVFNSDSRNLTGHSVGKVGVRKSTVTITPRAGLEGLAPSPNWTAVGNANMRVALPSTYDSRKPAPVVMMFHGNGSNETHFADNAAGKAVANAFLSAGYIAVSAANGPNVSTWGAQAGLDAYYAAYQYVRDHYSIGPVVFYGNSMGGLESLLSLAERRIPGVVAWVGTVPVCNLAANYVGTGNAQLFTSTIATAYGIAGDGSDYATKTAGHDAVLKSGQAFRGLPMWVLVATDDTSVIPADNWNLMEPKIQPYAAEYVRTNVTGGHSTSAIASNASAMVTFANKYIAG